MHFEDEVVKSLTFYQHYCWDKWKENDADGEESNGNTSNYLIKTGAILQLDNVHSAQSVKVLEYDFVSVNEHSDQEAQKQNVEDVDEEGNEYLSFRVGEIIEVLLTIETIKDVEDDLEEG